MTFEWPVALLPVRKFIGKHHAVVFISFIALLLTAAIYILYIASTAKPAAEESTSAIGAFDKKTIDKIKKLHDSTDAIETLDFPAPRSNPFTE